MMKRTLGMDFTKLNRRSPDTVAEVLSLSANSSTSSLESVSEAATGVASAPASPLLLRAATPEEQFEMSKDAVLSAILSLSNKASPFFKTQEQARMFTIYADMFKVDIVARLTEDAAESVELVAEKAVVQAVVPVVASEASAPISTGPVNDDDEDLEVSAIFEPVLNKVPEAAETSTPVSPVSIAEAPQEERTYVQAILDALQAFYQIVRDAISFMISTCSKAVEQASAYVSSSMFGSRVPSYDYNAPESAQERAEAFSL